MASEHGCSAMNCAVRISRRTAFAWALISCGFRPTSDALAQSEVNLVMHTETFRDAASGQWIRCFSGRAAPREAFIDPDTGAIVRPRDLFPNQNDPFAINDRLQLGEGGYALRTLDRARLGMAPGRDHQSWSMNMIPFGVLLDGSILDPSGPWYDGGPADPNNPFDRACTGWEYEVTHPVVSQLVGVPALIAGHVQPSGMFHYHGYPRLLIEALRSEALARGKSGGPLTVGTRRMDFLCSTIASPKARAAASSFASQAMYCARGRGSRSISPTPPRCHLAIMMVYTCRITSLIPSRKIRRLKWFSNEAMPNLG